MIAFVDLNRLIQKARNSHQEEQLVPTSCTHWIRENSLRNPSTENDLIYSLNDFRTTG